MGLVMLSTHIHIPHAAASKSRLRRLEVNPQEALCANMNETLPPSEFRVEGGEGLGDEYLE
jgi:hypothetical protein